MSVKWELPRAGSPGSLTSFGLQLRRSFGEPLSLTDGRMADLIEQLHRIPGAPPQAGAADPAMPDRPL